MLRALCCIFHRDAFPVSLHDAFSCGPVSLHEAFSCGPVSLYDAFSCGPLSLNDAFSCGPVSLLVTLGLTCYTNQTLPTVRSLTYINVH